MIDWFKEKFSRPKYPTLDEVPLTSDLEKINEDMSKVIQFPHLSANSAKNKEEVANDITGKAVYSLGLTDNGRVSMIMGYSTFTMNSVGVQHLIDQLILFKSQIEEIEDDE